VAKQSDVTVKLNAGSHILKFYAISSNPAEREKVTFGESSPKKNLVILKNQELKLKFIGPFRWLGSGSVEGIK
jgi:hypothetical protein